MHRGDLNSTPAPDGNSTQFHFAIDLALVEGQTETYYFTFQDDYNLPPTINVEKSPTPGIDFTRASTDTNLREQSTTDDCGDPSSREYRDSICHAAGVSASAMIQQVRRSYGIDFVFAVLNNPSSPDLPNKAVYLDALEPCDPVDDDRVQFFLEAERKVIELMGPNDPADQPLSD